MKLRHVTLHQMRIFHSLGRHMSFTRAAEELHLSQPAVSIQVKRLEESVELPLFEQMGKRIYLTEAGKELFEACQDVLERLRVLDQDMTGLEEGVRGPLNVAAITSSKYFMPHLLGAFLREYPAVEPRLTVTNQTRVVERLIGNQDDLVILGTFPDELELEAAYFLDNPLVVVAPPNHPLVGKKRIKLQHLLEERFLEREPGSGTRAALSRLFGEEGMAIRPYMELGSSEAIKQGVMAGLGISVLSLHNLRLELKSGLIAVLDVEHFPLMRQWYAVHLKGKKLSATTRKFLEFLLRDGARIWRDSQPHLQHALPLKQGSKGRSSKSRQAR